MRKRNQMKLRITAIAGMLILGTAIPSHASTTVDVSTGQLNFGADSGTNQANTIGELAGLSFTHRYNNVFSGVDAVLTVLAVNNIDSDDDALNGVDNLFDNVDRFSSTTGKAIDINIDIAGEAPVSNNGNSDQQSGSVTLRADFVQAGTNNPVTLQNISINVADIDSNQYVSFSGISAYEFSSSPATELTASSANGVYEFKEPAGRSSNSTDQENWVLVEYTSANSITWTVGARESGSAFYSVSFADAVWSAPPTRPAVSLTAFNLTYNDNAADSGAVPATQSSTVNSSAVTLVAPQGNLVKANTCFSGWNTRADGTGTNYVNGDTITLTGSTTLYANWTCPTVTFNSNTADSGTPPSSQSATANSSSVTLVAAQGNLVKANACFRGWNTRADGTGTNYVNGDAFTLASNTTLYANWTCPTVSFNSNTADSGSVPASQSATANSSAVTLAAAQGNLVKANCTLNGWNTRADGTGTNYLNGESITLAQSTVLYAKWNCQAPAALVTTPSQTTNSSTQTAVTKSVPTLANTGASEFKGLLALGLAGIGVLMISYARRTAKG